MKFLTNSTSLKRSAPTPQDNDRIFLFLVLLLYAASVLFLSTVHEVWRDEVRAFSIATYSHDLRELFHNLVNEGHPALWYLYLRGLFSLFPSPVVLKLGSLLVAITGAAIFLFRSPFERWLKVLWVFGFYPLYEYSVYCRNYGLGMLLLVSYCALYSKRFTSPLVMGVLLVLLGATSIYGLILAGALTVSLVFELLFFSRPEFKRIPGMWLLTLSVVSFGLGLSFFQMLPDSTSAVTAVNTLSLSSVSKNLVAALLSHGSIAHNAFSLPFSFVVPLMLVAVYLCLLSKPELIVFLMTAVIGVECLHRLVYSAEALRHQGFVYLAVVATLWLERLSPAAKRPRLILTALFTVLLTLQVYMGGKYIIKDVQRELSSAGDFAALINSDPRLISCILISEPDFILETMPYYVNNKLYFPRESKFGYKVSFTSAAKKSLSLTELITDAQMLSTQHHRPVLLLLPLNLNPSGGTNAMMYGREFVYSAEDINRLAVTTEKLATFSKALGDENFSVYLLRDNAVQG